MTSARRVGVFEWMRAVRDAPLAVLPRRVKGTLFVLATYAAPDGSGAFPGMDRLGDNVGKAADNVGRDLKLAVDRGYLTRSRSNRQQTYRYRLTIPTADPTESSSRNQPDPTESSDRDPTETSGYLPRTPTQTKTPSASSSTTPTTDVAPDPASDVEREALAAADPTTNGDDMLGDSPAAEDPALLATLADLPGELGDRARREWKTPGGPDKLRYCVKWASASGPLSVARFEALLDSPYEAYTVVTFEDSPRFYVFRTYGEATATIERLSATGEVFEFDAYKGDEAKRLLAEIVEAA